MKQHSRLAALLLLTGITLRAVTATSPQLAGRWDGTVQFPETTIQFPFEIDGSGANLRASFFNGEERITSTSVTLQGSALTANFDHYASQLNATVQDGVIKGTYGNKLYGVHEIELRPHRPPAPVKGPVPDVSGRWILPFESKKGEHAFRFIVRQHGAELAAAILRVDGDTGVLQGRYQTDRFLLNHFDGARATTLELLPRPDGRLDLTLRGFHAPNQTFTATREKLAAQQGLPAPADFSKHTRVKNPDEPFAFNFPDLNGKPVSNLDERFKNKVLIVNITGSWCPNCHDEAPFLAEIYRRYHPLGLEIVALDFEEAEQSPSLARLHAFIKRYGIQYTYLLAGTPDQLKEKVPQGDNLNSWPTTFFIGRDGKVKASHTGFAATASGEFHDQLKREFATTVERLLAQR